MTYTWLLACAGVSLGVAMGLDAVCTLLASAWRCRYRRAGLVQVMVHTPVPVPYPVSAEHPPEDFDG